MTRPHEELLAWCHERLAAHAETAKRDPLASGVRMLAIDLWDLARRREISRDDLIDFARHIGADALRDRALRLKSKTEGRSVSAEVAEALAIHEGASFAAVKEAIEETRAGIVFTAHPTFALPRRLRRAVGDIAETGDTTLLVDGPHEPDGTIALADEHQDVLLAISNAQAALRDLLIAIFNWARARFPDDWASITPAPISLASWVGYDLDGRTDIHWGQTIALRLEEKAIGLDRYADLLAGVKSGGAIAEELRAAARLAREQATLFEADLSDPAAIVAAANRLTGADPARMTSASLVSAGIERALAEATTDDDRLLLSIARAELRAYGLGVSRIHLRVNAAQVRSALRADLGLADEREFLDRTSLDAAAAITAQAQVQPVNFGDVFQEQMTARRQLMLCAQILKHIDAETPIRFLIAEVESPATVMGAIYLARLYGVDRQIDISPLFETPEAIERGGRFVERLLEEEQFVDYVRGRGRITIQCGFSDSGRFMGQIAAEMAIERLQILVARALAAKGVGEIEVVIFNTHGESMGRGGHPGDFGRRLDHLLTPWARARFAKEGLRLNAECSFQGGDGFLHFETPGLAGATVSSIFGWSQRPPERSVDDRFYADINYSWDIYRTIKGWQEDLFADRHYQAALSSFAPNLLPTTGSRKTRRQSGASQNDAARSLRAIPHNAILQQLAAPANVLGGIGAAAIREPERFTALAAGSPRIRALLEMATAARRLTSLSILRSYASFYDPSFWTVRASRSRHAAERRPPLRVAERLALRSLDVELGRLANILSVDRQNYDAVVGTGDGGAAGVDEFPADLYALHAVRMAMIADALTLAASTPDFSPRHDVTRESIIDLAIDLRLADVARQIEEIFPESDDAPAEFARLAERSAATGPGGYPEIRRDIIEPLRVLDRRIKEISVIISHFYDAFG